MGQRGPIPKRSDQRVRRNKEEVPVEKLPTTGAVDIPPLGFFNPHPLVVSIYQSLQDSAQNKFYEPSDWEYARFALHFADQLLKSDRPSSVMLASVTGMLNDLLVSEGDRRRVRLEIDRTTPEDTGGDVLQVADLFRERLAQG